ncbi:MAG: hypothetical protein SOW24_04680, partial [Eubacteriales bacterium]|nr:hypothetical protein [Eubacteriales bacterium]
MKHLKNEKNNSASSLPKGLMVCVTGQRTCERLVLHGANRLNPHEKLYIVHCVREGKHFLGSED